MSIYPGDRPLSRNITDREFRKLEIFPELVEALVDCQQALTNAIHSAIPNGSASKIAWVYAEDKAKAVITKAKGEMK